MIIACWTTRSPPEKARRLMPRYIMGPIFYTAATVVGFIAPWLAVAIFAGLDVFFLLPQSPSQPSTNSEGRVFWT